MANILHRLLPREEKFFDMLKEQALNVLEGAFEFKNLVYNYNKLSFSKKKSLVKKIDNIEHKGDDIAHKIIEALDKTFITPLDKEDIHRLTLLLDDVIDMLNKTSLRLIIFKIYKIDSHIKDLTQIAEQIINKTNQGISRLSKPLNLTDFYIDVHTLENKGDIAHRNALTNLFDKKDAFEIIKYKEIYEFLEDIIDKCEDIACVIESIVVKHA